MAIRFGRKNAENWPKMQPLKNSKYPHNKLIMFSSSHDLFYEDIKLIEESIEKLLANDNKILFVTKPRFKVIKYLLDFFGAYYGNKIKDKIEFRFTIGSSNNEVLSFWEPNAPSFEERLKATEIINKFNEEINEKIFSYSISMEPLLTLHPENIINKIPNAKEYWLGKMNYVNLNNPKNEKEKIYFERQKRINSESFWKKLYIQFKDFDKIKWKDSVISYINIIKKNKTLI